MDAHTETHAGLKIRIVQDSDCESPLDYDSTPTIAYLSSSRYTLGNEAVDRDEMDEIAKRIRSVEYIGLPVYAYVHGSVALRTGSFEGLLPQGHAEFDSGQSGFVYIDRAIALEWTGKRRLTKAARKQVYEWLESAVDEFSKWLNGECYGFTIENEEGEHLDSCFGFIGFDYALQQARESAECCAKQEQESKRQAWRNALHEARERRYWAQRDVITA